MEELIELFEDTFWFWSAVLTCLLLWILLYFTGSFVISILGCGLPYVYWKLVFREKVIKFLESKLGGIKK